MDGHGATCCAARIMTRGLDQAAIRVFTGGRVAVMSAEHSTPLARGRSSPTPPSTVHTYIMILTSAWVCTRHR